MTEAAKNIIAGTLQPNGRRRVVAAAAVLFVGTTLLLLSILAWTDLTHMLGGRQEQQGQSSYVVIGKQVTEQSMGREPASFSAQEIKDIAHAPQVQDVGAIVPARFPVYATIGGRLAMATDLPVAAVPDRFIDSLPDRWNWQPGDRALPVILSSQFLDIYNYVFAPGQRLPQLSRTSVRAVALRLQAGHENPLVLSAYVAGFSDRINSLLVPMSFIEYGNDAFAGGGQNTTSQLILRVNDPSDGAFNTYLQQHGYTTDPQNLRWSRMRTIVQAVASATGVFALLLMGISTLVFMLFAELTVARSQASLVLLRQLGYSAAVLRRAILMRFLPMAATAMALSVVVCCGIQVGIAHIIGESGLHLPMVPGWQYWAAFATSSLLLWLLLARAVRRAIR
ncbi:hypothetical protein GCM10023093_08600 [Nemorincola caseinilytica]|uniref:ABC transporter permease n=1 Tax=Nemorincola caseinilytica TaxID=2054315 RepID=A0ABP8N6Q9_9BACT